MVSSNSKLETKTNKSERKDKYVVVKTNVATETLRGRGHHSLFQLSLAKPRVPSL